MSRTPTKPITLPRNDQRGLSKPSLEAGLEQMTGAAFGMLATLVANGLMPGPAALLLGALVQGGAIQSLQSHRDGNTRHAAHWTRGVGAWAEFVEQARHPESQEALVASLRAALDVIDDELAACLGALGRLYADEARRPDRFFRACTNVFTTIDRTDLVGMRSLVDAVINALASEREGDSVAYLMGMTRNVDGAQVPGVEIRVVPSDTPAGKPAYESIGETPSILAHLSQIFVGMQDDRPRGSSRDVHRLARVLRPAP